MSGDISVADALPCPSVTLTVFGRAVVFIVLTHILFRVSLTEPAVREFGTAVVSAGLLWFRRQRGHILSRIKKAATVSRNGLIYNLLIILYHSPILSSTWQGRSFTDIHGLISETLQFRQGRTHERASRGVRWHKYQPRFQARSCARCNA